MNHFSCVLGASRGVDDTIVLWWTWLGRKRPSSSPLFVISGRFVLYRKKIHKFLHLLVPRNRTERMEGTGWRGRLVEMESQVRYGWLLCIISYVWNSLKRWVLATPTHTVHHCVRVGDLQDHLVRRSSSPHPVFKRLREAY